MAWGDAGRLVGFQSVLAAPRLQRYLDADSRLPIPGAQARALVIDAMLWLELGVRVNYWSEAAARPELDELRAVFDGIYDWLKTYGSRLPAGLVDDALRIKDDGLASSNRRVNLSDEATDAAGLHLRAAMTFVGRGVGRNQGVSSSLVAHLMFAPDDDWNNFVAGVDAEAAARPSDRRGPIGGAIGLLRYMDGALSVANAAAADARFNVAESQRVSNEILSLLSWCVNLGDPVVRKRFDEVFDTILANMRNDRAVAPLERRVRGEISNLATAWSEIAHPEPAWAGVW